MNIIVYGTEKSSETRKALRFLKERRLEHQFRNLGEKSLTEGELKNLCVGGVRAQDLIDDQSGTYKTEGFAWREFDAFEALIDYPSLIKMPILRVERKVFVCPDLNTISLII